MKEYTTVVTRKGQVTIPVEIRRSLEISEGDRVAFLVEGGAVRLTPSAGVVARTAGILKAARALPGDAYVDAVAGALQDMLPSQGWAVTPWNLRDEKSAYCLGCFECWTKTPGLCRIDNAGRDIARSVIQSDLAIYLTPITFGGYSSELKKAVDRIICLISPFFSRIDGEVHHRARYHRYPALLGVGVLPAPHSAQEQLFYTLVGRNAINMHTPAHQSAVVYRSQDPAAAVAAPGPVLIPERRTPA